jgi:hypothetical protein
MTLPIPLFCHLRADLAGNPNMKKYVMNCPCCGKMLARGFWHEEKIDDGKKILSVLNVENSNLLRTAFVK